MAAMIILFSVEFFNTMYHNRLGSALSPLALITFPLTTTLVMVVGYFIGCAFEAKPRKIQIDADGDHLKPEKSSQTDDSGDHAKCEDSQTGVIRTHPAFLFFLRHKAITISFSILLLLILVYPIISEPLLIYLEYANERNHDGFYIERVNRKIAEGVDVNKRDKDGRTFLFDAAIVGDKRSLKVLLANGYDPKARNNMGRTPLHEAGWGGCPGVSQLLVDNGADVNAKNNNGYTQTNR